MRSFAEDVAPNKPHGFGRDWGGGGGRRRGGGGREALRMQQPKIHPSHGGWSTPLLACQQSRPAVGLSTLAPLTRPDLHHRQQQQQLEARLHARILARFFQKLQQQPPRVFRVDVPPARQDNGGRSGAPFLGVLSRAAAVAARPPRRQKPSGAPLQMALSAAPRRKRSGSGGGGQACGGASVESAVRGGARLLHKKPLHISGARWARRVCAYRGAGGGAGGKVRITARCPSAGRCHHAAREAGKYRSRGAPFQTHTHTPNTRAGCAVVPPPAASALIWSVRARGAGPAGGRAEISLVLQKKVLMKY